MESSTRLVLVGRFLLALLAVLALGATVASVAQAEPRSLIWRVNGSILKENATKGLAAKAATNVVLDAAAGPKITCTTVNLGTDAFIANEGGANGQAISEAAVELSGCKVEDNGLCFKVKEPIITKRIKFEPVLNDLGPGIGAKILEEFNPAAGSEKEFVELTFEGEKCKFANLIIKNSVIGSFASGEKELELTNLPIEETSFNVKFPDEPTSVYLWKAARGKWELFEPAQLNTVGAAVKLSGTVSFSLTSTEKYTLAES